jgi:hypothetical protein
MFVVASGAPRSFYLAGAQEQNTTDTSATENAEVTLGSTQVQSGSTLDVNGNNFGANSDVSIYMMSAVQAELEDGTATILQEAAAAAGNESATTAEIEESAGAISLMMLPIRSWDCLVLETAMTIRLMPA